MLQNRLAANLPRGLSGVDAATYATSFVGALRWTLAVPTALLVLAGLSCLWIKSLGADTPTVGPSTDDLTGTDRTDSRLGFETRSELMNQSSQLLLTGGRLCPRISARRATERNAWLVI